MDIKLDLQVGELVTGDFSDNTMLFEIENDMTLKAGKYAILPIEQYNELIKLINK